MTGEAKREYGRCFDCDFRLELYEIDFQGGRRVLRCKRCGLLHLYNKDFFGRWKLLKVTKALE